MRSRRESRNSPVCAWLWFGDIFRPITRDARQTAPQKPENHTLDTRALHCRMVFACRNVAGRFSLLPLLLLLFFRLLLLLLMLLVACCLCACLPFALPLACWLPLASSRRPSAAWAFIQVCRRGAEGRPSALFWGPAGMR